MNKAWMSWSTGKDSAFTLHELRSRPEYKDIEVTGLLTTLTDSYHRVSMHAVREELLDLQAKALNLPIHKVRIPAKCTNEIYEARMSEAIIQAKQVGVSFMGFGDLFLEDIRQYRVSKLSGSGIEPIFPLWQRPTLRLAHEMIDSGMKAIITCVDPSKLPESFAGREFNSSVLSDLPEGVDPCGRADVYPFHSGQNWRKSESRRFCVCRYSSLGPESNRYVPFGTQLQRSHKFGKFPF